MYFLPKKDVDISKNELNRAWRLTGANQAEQFSFKVPRRGAGFSEDIYPPCFSGESSMTYDEWSKGENKDPVYKAFDPNAAGQPKPANLGNKIGGGFKLKDTAKDPHAVQPS